VSPHGKTLLLINPAAGGGRARRFAPQVISLLRKHGLVLDPQESRNTEDLQQRAARAAAADYQVVAMLGGDGAMHHAVNAALGSGVDFAFFPAGNGNDIARGLDLPLDPFAAAMQFLRGRPRPVDVLRARFRTGAMHHYLAAGGLGLDAEAARLVHTRFRRLPGALRYISAALWALRECRPVHLQVQTDGEAWQGAVLLAAVANGPCYGAGVRIEPAARMDDGALNVVLVGELPFLRILDAILIVLRTGDLRWPEIRRLRARRVVFTPVGGSAWFHGDGEVLGQAPLEVEVLPGAARFVL
jgi:diacylglycerol kinase (ATP)